MKKHIFRILVVLLVVVLAIVSFYMLYVHVPYYNYHHDLDEIRNEICEKNNYQYQDYFYEYHGKDVYYIMKVKVKDIETFVAYNEKLELVADYRGKVADQKKVIQAIEKKYKEDQVKIDQLQIGYENNRFVYYAKFQTKETLLYVYYHLDDGEFMKAVKLGE